MTEAPTSREDSDASGSTAEDTEALASSSASAESPESRAHVDDIARALALDGRWLDRLSRMLVIGLVLSVGVILLDLLSAVLLPVLVAWLIAWVVNPVVDTLEEKRVPRWAGILGVGVVSLAALAALLLLLLPVFVTEFIRALEQAPEWIDELYGKVAMMLERHAGLGTEVLDAFLDDVLEEAKKLMGAGLGALTASVSALMNIVLIPVFAFYFLLDFRGMHQKALDVLPVSVRDVVRERALAMDEAVGRWLRGQLKVASALAVLLAIALGLIGLRMGFVIGLVSGLLNVFPFVGAMIGLVVSLLLALAGGGGIGYLLLVVGVFLGLQAFESYWLTPRWVGSSVGLGPVSVIVVILAGGTLFGFLGVILAVPLTAALAVLTRDVLAVWRRLDAEGQDSDTASAGLDAEHEGT